MDDYQIVLDQALRGLARQDDTPHEKFIRGVAMFSQHLVEPEAFALRFVELLPEYLPGVDTGAFEPTDRQRCWNKTLKGVLTAIGKEYEGIDVAAQDSIMIQFKEQASLLWQHDAAPLFAMTTG